jgi:hypothetical protein
VARDRCGFERRGVHGTVDALSEPAAGQIAAGIERIQDEQRLGAGMCGKRVHRPSKLLVG